MSGDVATPKFPQTVVILSTGISLGSARGKPLVGDAASHICLPGGHSASLQRRRIKHCWTPSSAAISQLRLIRRRAREHDEWPDMKVFAFGVPALFDLFGTLSCFSYKAS